MYESFGAFVNHNKKEVEFRLFYPDNTLDPKQYKGNKNPNIDIIQVTGDFQSKLGGVDWDYMNAPQLSGPVVYPQSDPKGYLYTYNAKLEDGFYQYKFFITFKNGERRWVTDPCTKYGGKEYDNAAFVIGGNMEEVKAIPKRLYLPDLIIYEMMIDNFTAEYRNTLAPLEAIESKIETHLKPSGINAIEFMPWTAWPGSDFNWGYEPILFFSVEDRYTNNESTPLDKLYKLQKLINKLHENNIHIIMDGVFNHVNRAFPYSMLYQNPDDSPFVGSYGGGGFGKDLDFNNSCTHEFVFDVCRYWIENYQIDGIRFDYTLGFYKPNDSQSGITRLISDLKKYFKDNYINNFSLILEHLTHNRYEAINDTNYLCAAGCWFDPFMFELVNYSKHSYIDTELIRVLNAGKDFTSGKCPVIYIENHDHSTIINQIGDRNRWWQIQCALIALFTSPGAVLIHNGQEFGEDYYLPASGYERIKPRKLCWDKMNDHIGRTLFNLVKKLARLRNTYPSLRSSHYYPEHYSDYFNNQGYGIDRNKGVVIYHRWGTNDRENLERFIIILNFSHAHMWVDIPFSCKGEWNDLLNEKSVYVNDNCWLYNQRINSHWGRIYYHESEH